MDQMLNQNDKLASFLAVRQFLFDGEKFANGGLIPCYWIERGQKTRSNISISLIDHIPSYNLDDGTFKSYGLRNPIWSAYKLLEWDESNRELIIGIDQYREIRLKRINE
jgi:hypothetical protein